MGKLLQVRVMAYTVDPEDVARTWPRLSALAYPAAHDYAPAKRGVVEMVDTLSARLDSGEISRELAARLQPSLKKAEDAVRGLDQALGSWNVDEARRLTERIETILDDLEETAGDFG